MWTIPELLKRKAQAQRDQLRARNHLQEQETPQQHLSGFGNEIWIHDGHTKADRNRERKQRAANYRREQEASERSEKRSRLQNQEDEDMSESQKDGSEGREELTGNENGEEPGAIIRQRRRRPKSVRFSSKLLYITNTRQRALPNADDFVSLGDCLLFRFDKETRKQDRDASKYQLPLYIGRVEAIADDEIEVWWMYSNARDFSHGWHLWRTRATKKSKGEPYKTTMGTEHVLVDSFGAAARLSFMTRRTGPGVHAQYLDARSISVIKEILDADSITASSAPPSNTEND